MKRIAIAILCLGMFACSSSRRFQQDAGHDLDGGVASDGAVVSGSKVSAALGKACKRDADCPTGTFCDEEIPNMLPVSGAPSGSVDLPLFPGGSCSPLPLSPYDPDGGTSCDPAEPRAVQGCGSHGACVSEAVDTGTLVACRVACTPSETASGCARDHYTCDFALHACIEGCGSDTECRLLSLDSNNDGVADGLAYDSASKATCDMKTGRCTHPGGSAQVGAACERNDQCEVDGTCIRDSMTLAGHLFPGGACTKLGCDVKGRECGDGSVCEALRPWSAVDPSQPACLTSCRVGAEPAAQQVGISGHGDGCKTGYRCHYNGGAGADDGVCVGGNYNAVKTSNVGDDCATDAECYSPFGFGRCLHLRVGDVTKATGTCTLMDCAAPGLPKNVCGTGNDCILLRDDITFCVRTCTAASECPAGSACADDDANPDTSSICFPACFDDGECRAKEHCLIAAGGSAGQCVAMTGKGG